MSENSNKNSGRRVVFLTIMILLTTSFLMFFIIGKFNSTPAKGQSQEGESQSIMSQSKEIENTKPQREKEQMENL